MTDDLPSLSVAREEHPGPLAARRKAERPQLRPGRAGTLGSLEDLLADLETGVTHAARVFLFTGERLRLDITLLRHEKNPHVIWGLRRHEEWAFKATLLRFARGEEPVHLLLAAEREGHEETRCWVVGRTMDAFWAAPLPAEQARAFWMRCLEPVDTP